MKCSLEQQYTAPWGFLLPFYLRVDRVFIMPFSVRYIRVYNESVKIFRNYQAKEL